MYQSGRAGDEAKKHKSPAKCGKVGISGRMGGGWGGGGRRCSNQNTFHGQGVRYFLTQHIRLILGQKKSIPLNGQMKLQ